MIRLHRKKDEGDQWSVREIRERGQKVDKAG